MTAEETLVLYAKGRDAWNAWAEEMLAEKNESVEWEEKAKVNCNSIIFVDSLFFYNFIFPGEADFTNCEFKVGISFNKAKFHGGAFFTDSIFFDSAYFQDAIFYKDAAFSSTEFHFDAWFDRTNFNEGIDLSRAKFTSLASFTNCIFNKSVDLSHSNFQIAQFGDAEFEKSLSLTNTKFAEVPDFYATKFKETPHFDTMKITNVIAKNNLLSTSNWRSLRQLAAKSNDHEAELNFFAGELKSRPEWYNRVWVFFYELTSDFGRSIMRPLLGIVFLMYLGYGVYFAQHQNLNLPTTSCSPEYAATLLTLEKALPLISGKDEKAKQNMLCLYGEISKDTPNIPDSVSLIGTLQTLLSLIFLFLAGLGIRNRFRLK